MTTSRLRHEEAIEFRLLYVVGFIVFLVGALIARLWPARPAAYGLVPRSRSIFGEARAAANTYLPYAFMR